MAEGGRGSPHYLCCSAVKSPGIAFITEPNEKAEADYSCDGEKRRAGSLFIGRKRGGGRGKTAAWLYILNNTPNKCVCVHEWVFVKDRL